MEKYKIVYVFDTYCSWCYGMGPVLEQIEEKYEEVLDFEAISGGMIREDTGLAKLAKRFLNPRESFNRVMEMTGQPISDSFIDMIENPGKEEYIFNSIYPARAMVTLKYFSPEREIEQAEVLQKMVYMDLADLTKTSSYKPVAEKFGINWDAFVHHFESEQSLQDAKYEFHLARQLKVTAYPAVLLQTGDQYFNLIARGYTPFEVLDQRIHTILDNKNQKDEASMS